MKICKKILTILLISLILLYSIIPSKVVSAEEGSATLSQKEAGQIIADFAKNMVEQHASETIYDYGDLWAKEQNHGRIEAYKGNKVSGTAQGAPDPYTKQYETKEASNKYFMDCVGFVSFCVHHSLGIDGFGRADKIFVAPGGIRDFTHFEYVTDGSLQPGDILIKNGHVMIYVDKGYVAEAQDKDSTWQVKRRNSWPDYHSVARIKADAAAKIFRNQTKNAWDGHGSADGTGDGLGAPEVDDSAEFDKYIGNGNLGGIADANKFYYNGAPKSGEYLGKTKDGNWLFKKIENAADWLLGVITMNIKIQAIGWTNIFEGLANSVLELIVNEKAEDVDTMFVLNGERKTVEDIIYNRIPMLDVNLFDFQNAGGETLSQDSVIYMLRAKIASWYVVVRTICIILLLFTLIYLGIRTAIASIAKDKAIYKQKLIAWLVGFIVVMFIHYFMIIILNLNQIAINWVKPNGSSSLVYEEVRALAYEIPATKGWTGTIIYVFLVYYLIRMLLFYFKRVLIVYILAIISPAMGVVYAIQKINGKSKALGMWMREFAFNVLIQFVHAVIYTILMGVIVGMIAKFTVWQIVPYAVLLFVSLNFLLDAENIVKNIFKIESNSLKSVLQTVFDYKNRFATALAIGSFAYGQGKKFVVNQYDKHVKSTLNTKYDKYKIEGDSELAKSVNAEIDRLKEEERQHIKEADTNAIKFAKSQFDNAISLVGAVPAIFESPMAGAVAFGYKASTVGGTFKPGKYGEAARKLDKSTEGSQYIYIQEPDERTELEYTRYRDANNRKTANTGSGNDNNKGNTTGAKEKSGTDNGNDKPIIRTYNKKKIRKLTVKNVGLGAVSWATVGASKNITKVIKAGKEEERIIEKVYSTRIEKLHVIGNRAVKEIGTINKELDNIKTRNSPPIYYEPKPNENKTQVAMNEKLREKYREILKKNIIQAYGGVDKDEIAGRIVNHGGNKVTLKTVKDIAKEYLAENECNTGIDFDDNLNNVLKQKIIDTVENKKTGFEKIKLKDDLEEKVIKATKDSNGDTERLKQKLDKVITKQEKDEIVSKISVKDLTELISKTLETKGSIEMNRDFKNLQEPIENLKLLNDEAEATTGNEMYTTEQLLDLIMNKDIRE